MIDKLKKIDSSFLNPFKIFELLSYRMGSRHQCYVCKKTFNRFTKFDGGTKNQNSYIKTLAMVGSNNDNYGCIYCHSNDRLRHLFMYFDKLNLWDKIKGGNMLHFAPEKNLVPVIEKLKPALYVKGDLYPADSSIQKIDITAIPFGDSYFDFIMCSHVLEHIPDYKKAFSELYRVLKPGGAAILQTPFSRLLKRNFEDESINTDELRLVFYGQTDHVRVVAEEHFLMDLKAAGFEMNVIKNSDLFNAEECRLYGVNEKEDLIMVGKKQNH